MLTPQLARFHSDLGQAIAAYRFLISQGHSKQELDYLAYTTIYCCRQFYTEGMEHPRYQRQFFDYAFFRHIFKTTDFPKSRVIGNPSLKTSGDGISFIEDVEVDPSAAAPSVKRSPGFIYRSWGSLTNDDEIRRIYLSIVPYEARFAAVELFARLAQKIPGFDLKLLANPRSYARFDACVIYTPRTHFDAALAIVLAALDRAEMRVRQAWPLGTGVIVPGVAYADNPPPLAGQQVSYGQWIVRLIADAVQFKQQSQVEDGVLAALVQHGWNPDRPFERLTPG